MQSGARFSALDGIRALAIALVLARHGARPFEADAPAVLLNGWMGVDLFFALSGFLVGWHILNRYGGAEAQFRWRDYASGRLLRIAPAYLATVALIIFGFFPFYEPASRDLFLSTIRHVIFLQDFGGADLAVTLWSLGVEAKFYLLAPFLLFLAWRLKSTRARLIALSAIALLPLACRAILHAQAPPQNYEAFFAVFRSPFYVAFDGLALGLAAASALKAAPFLCQRAAPYCFWIGSFGLLAFLAAPPWLERITWFDAVLMQSILALCCASIVLGAACGAGPQRVLGARFMRALGARAYCLYLVHYPLIPLALGVSLLATDGAADPFMFTLAYLASSFLFAEALHRFVEKPFLAVKDKKHDALAEKTRAA